MNIIQTPYDFILEQYNAAEDDVLILSCWRDKTSKELVCNVQTSQVETAIISVQISSLILWKEHQDKGITHYCEDLGEVLTISPVIDDCVLITLTWEVFNNDPEESVEIMLTKEDFLEIVEAFIMIENTHSVCENAFKTKLTFGKLLKNIFELPLNITRQIIK